MGSGQPGPSRLAAFLRGINLGGRRVTNDRLRKPFEALELEGVATYRASGNVIFDDPGIGAVELEGRIEARIEEELGFRAGAHVRSLSRLASVVAYDELTVAREEGFRVHVVFLRKDAGAETLSELRALESEDDRFLGLGSEVAWLRRGRLTDSPIETRHLEAALGGPEHTMRTLGTVERIVDKFGSRGDTHGGR